MEKLKTVSATSARARIFGLIDEAAENHQPVLITTKRNNAVLVSEEDWDALHETMYLLSIPGMRESLLDASNSSDEDFLTEDEFRAALEEEDRG